MLVRQFNFTIRMATARRKSLTHLYPQVLDQARALDDSISRGGGSELGSLAGSFVGIKVHHT